MEKSTIVTVGGKVGSRRSAAVQKIPYDQKKYGLVGFQYTRDGEPIPVVSLRDRTRYPGFILRRIRARTHNAKGEVQR